MYFTEATTLEGFVQQLVCYITSGYRYYVTGRIPGSKDPQRVDRHLVEKYGIALSKYQRARRKRSGKANLQYLRFRSFFVILATPPLGAHAFYQAEGQAVRDIRRQPIRLAGYAISSRRDGSELKKGIERWRAHVRVDREAFLELRDYYLDAALRRSRRELEAKLQEARFEPYAPVRRQLLSVIRAVNRKRKTASLLPLRTRCIRFQRTQVRPFDPAQTQPPEPDAGYAGMQLVVVLGFGLIAWRLGGLQWALLALGAYLVWRGR